MKTNHSLHQSTSRAQSLAINQWRLWSQLSIAGSVLIMLALAAYVALAGSTGQIRGVVYRVADSVTKSGDSILPGVNVQIVGTSRGAVSDPNGEFLIRNVAPGTYDLRISSAGFESQTITGVVVKADQTSEVIARLELSPTNPDGPTIVKGKRDSVEKSNVSGTSVQGKPELEKKPVSTVDDILKTQAGVQTSRSGQVYLRCEQGARVDGQVLEGVPITDGLGGTSGQMLQYQPAPMPPNTERYAEIAENDFHRAQTSPLSTFSIDVDAASYSNIRRFLTDLTLPPAEAVRTEELINYFDYDYPNPSGEHPFSITTEIGTCPWDASHQLVHVGIQGRRMENREMPPNNLVFLIDVSGSMSSPDKLPLVQKSFRLLVEELRPIDRVAIVVYASTEGLVLESTPGNQKARILHAIERLESGGSTAGGAGIQLAYKIAQQQFNPEGNNRVILATDGDFNVGVSSERELEKLIESKRKSGVFLTVLGFGTGNLQDSKMEILADKGNGNYAYIDNLLEGKKALVTEMSGTLLTIAKDVKIQVEFNPARVEAYRLVGYENRTLAPEDFNNDKKDAGELGAGHSVTALYEIVPIGGQWTRGVDPLRYQNVSATIPDKMPPHPDLLRKNDELLTIKFRYKEPDGDNSKLIVQHLRAGQNDERALSDNFRFSAAVAEFGMILSRSEHRGESSWDDVIAMAKSSLGRDEEGYRHEFVKLAETARLLGHNEE